MPRPAKTPTAAKNQYEVEWPQGKQPGSRVLVIDGGGQFLFCNSITRAEDAGCRRKTLMLTHDQAVGLERDGYLVQPSATAAKNAAAKAKAAKAEAKPEAETEES